MELAVITEPVAARFHLGHLIRDEREKRGWSQTRLGDEAGKFKLDQHDKPINVNTVSKVEGSPWTSEYGTVIRLLRALGLSFASIEQELGEPFVGTAPKARAPAERRRAKG